MKLGEAIEAGYAKHPGQWGKGNVYNILDNTYCAIGLALEGLGIDLAAIFNENPCNYLEYNEYAAFESVYGPGHIPTLYKINDRHCDSYEDLMMNLKQAGLYNLEARQ